MSNDTDWHAMMAMAKQLMQARGFLPQHLQNEGQVLATILAGRELGLPPMASLRSIYLINGKVGLAADIQLALMKKAGIKHTWEETSEKRAALKLERSGDAPHVQAFTLDDAKRAGLTGGNWQKHPAAMLRARCVSAAAKAYAPDVLAGVYDPEELEALPAPEPAPALEKPRRQPPKPITLTSGPEKGKPLAEASSTAIAAWLAEQTNHLDDDDPKHRNVAKRRVLAAEAELERRMTGEAPMLPKGDGKYPKDTADADTSGDGWGLDGDPDPDPNNGYETMGMPDPGAP